MITVLVTCGLIVACAVLNRVRGGGFGGDKLPGRALLWVTPAVFALASIVNPWPIALALALGYLFWGLWSWGYILAGLGGYQPSRSETVLEAALDFLGPYWLQTFVRMLFVLPGVAAVSWLTAEPRFLIAAPIFAAAATAVYAALFRSLGPYDWQRAEIGTGALWGLLLASPQVLS